MSSHAGDDAAEPCWRRRCLADLAARQYRYQVMLESVQPSHAGDGAIEATWPWCNIDVESCW
jgi:hypothetical protein